MYKDLKEFSCSVPGRTIYLIILGKHILLNNYSIRLCTRSNVIDSNELLQRKPSLQYCFDPNILRCEGHRCQHPVQNGRNHSLISEKYLPSCWVLSECNKNSEWKMRSFTESAGLNISWKGPDGGCQVSSAWAWGSIVCMQGSLCAGFREPGTRGMAGVRM